MRLGAHVSVAGSLDLAIDRALEIGCDCLQIFVGNPRQWRTVQYPAALQAEFRRKREESGLDPLVAHSCYLINLASPHREGRRRSVTRGGEEGLAGEKLMADSRRLMAPDYTAQDSNLEPSVP